MRVIFPALTASSNGVDVAVKDAKRYADTHGRRYYNLIIMSQKLRPPN